MAGTFGIQEQIIRGVLTECSRKGHGHSGWRQRICGYACLAGFTADGIGSECACCITGTTIRIGGTKATIQRACCGTSTVGLKTDRQIGNAANLGIIRGGDLDDDTVLVITGRVRDRYIDTCTAAV